MPVPVTPKPKKVVKAQMKAMKARSMKAKAKNKAAPIALTTASKAAHDAATKAAHEVLTTTQVPQSGSDDDSCSSATLMSLPRPPTEIADAGEGAGEESGEEAGEESGSSSEDDSDAAGDDSDAVGDDSDAVGGDALDGGDTAGGPPAAVDAAKGDDGSNEPREKLSTKTIS